MGNTKSKRNKTITTALNEGQIYLDRCITVTQKQNDLSNVIDKTIIGNMFEVCAMLPTKTVDLIIVDPLII